MNGTTSDPAPRVPQIAREGGHKGQAADDGEDFEFAERGFSHTRAQTGISSERTRPR